MNYQQFLKETEDGLSSVIAADEKIRIFRIQKKDGSRYRGIGICNGNGPVCPIIFPDPFFAMIGKGFSMQEVLAEIFGFYQMRLLPETDSRFFFSWKMARTRISCRLVNRNTEKKLLSRVLHRPMLDFEIVCFISVSCADGRIGCVPICPEYLALWKITEEELFHTALFYMTQLFPSVMEHADPLIVRMFFPEKRKEEKLSAEKVYILSNTAGIYGAACILDPETEKRLASESETCYLIPGSVHEFFAVPFQRGLFPEKVREAALRIQRGRNEQESFLSDRLYLYQRGEGFSVIP